jgi:hypothetical protein
MLAERPRFHLGERFVPESYSVPNFPSKKRLLDIEGRLRRPAFHLSSPTPRKKESIEGIQAMRTKQQGIKVRFGDSKTGKIKVKKRDKEGNVILDDEGNPIYDEKEFNFGLLAEILEGTASDNISKLSELTTKIDAGEVSASAGRDNLELILNQILGNINTIRDMTEEGFRAVERAVDLLPISRNPASLDLSLKNNRFATYESWKGRGGANQGAIVSFLIKNSDVEARLSKKQPVFGIGGNPINIVSLIVGMNANPQWVIDLETQRIFPTLESAIEETEEKEYHSYGSESLSEGDISSEEISGSGLYTKDLRFYPRFRSKKPNVLQRFLEMKERLHRMESNAVKSGLIPGGGSVYGGYYR